MCLRPKPQETLRRDCLELSLAAGFACAASWYLPAHGTAHIFNVSAYVQKKIWKEAQTFQEDSAAKVKMAKPAQQMRRAFRRRHQYFLLATWAWRKQSARW